MYSTKSFDKKQVAPKTHQSVRYSGKKSAGPTMKNGWQVQKVKETPKQTQKRQQQRRYEGVTPAFQRAVLNLFGLLEFATTELTSNLEANIRHALRETPKVKKASKPSAVKIAALLKNPLTIQNRFRMLEDFHPTYQQQEVEITTPSTTYRMLTTAPGHSYDRVLTPLEFAELEVEERPIVYMLNDRRAIMLEPDAMLTRSAFFHQKRMQTFPGFWRHVWDNPEKFEDILWSTRGKPMFSPRIRDSDVFAAAQQLNAPFFSEVTSSEASTKTLCKVSRSGEPCMRPVLRGGRCRLHLTSDRIHVCPKRVVGEAGDEGTPSLVYDRYQQALEYARRDRRKWSSHMRNIAMVQNRLETRNYFNPRRAEEPTHDVWYLHKHYETVRDRCGQYQAHQGERGMCPDCIDEAGPEIIPEMISEGRYNEAVTVWNIQRKQVRDRLSDTGTLPHRYWIAQYNDAMIHNDERLLDAVLLARPTCPPRTGTHSPQFNTDFEREFELHQAMRDLELTADDVDYESDASEEAGPELPHQVQAQGWFENVFGDIKVNVNWPDMSSMKMEHVLKIPIVDALIETLKEVNDNIPWTTVFVELAFFLAHIAAGGMTMANLLVTFAHLCHSTGLAMSLGNSLCEYFAGYFNAQAETPTDPMVLGVSATLALIASLAIDRLPDAKSLDRLMKRVGDLGKFVASGNIIASTFGTSIESLVDWLRIQLFGYSKLQEKSLIHVDAWLDEVGDLRKTDLEYRAGRDLNLPSTVNSLLSRGDEIARLYDRLKVPINQRTAFTTAMFFLNNARTIVSAHGAADRKMRSCPPVIHFFGDSGCGKTTTLSLLINHLLVALNCTKAEDRARRVFWRDPTQEYWEGYQPDTLITIYDDFGTFLDSVGNPDIGAGELIQTANTYPKSLTMAHVDLKGNVNFESKAIILTSNVPDFVHNSMSNPEALANRISLKFRQYVKPEYAITRKLKGKMVTSVDKTKLPIGDPLFTDAFLFQQVSKEDSNQPIGTPLTFNEMANLVVREMLASLALSDGMNKASEAHFNELVKSYSDRRDAPLVAALADAAKPVRAEANEDVEDASDDEGPEASYSLQEGVKLRPPVYHEDVFAYESSSERLTHLRRRQRTTGSVQQEAKQMLIDISKVATSPEERETLDMIPDHDPKKALTPYSERENIYWNYLGEEALTEEQFKQMQAEIKHHGFYGRTRYNYYPSITERLSDWQWWLGSHHVHVNVWESLRNRPLLTTHERGLNTYGYLRKLMMKPTPAETITMSTWASVYDHGCIAVPCQAVTPLMRCIAAATGDVLSGKYYQNKWCQGDPRRMWCLAVARAITNNTPWAPCIGEDHTTVNGRFFFNEAVRNVAAINTSASDERKYRYIESFENFAKGCLGVLGMTFLVWLFDLAIKMYCQGAWNLGQWLGKKAGAITWDEYKAQLDRKLKDSKKAEANYSDGARGSTRKNVETSYDNGARGAPRKNVEAEATTDQNATEVTTKVANNQYLIFRDLNQGGKATGTATAITGRVFMTSRHIWNALQGEFCLANADRKQYIIAKDKCKVSQPTGVHQNKDIVLFEAPRQVHLHSDLISYIVTREDVGSFETLNRVALIGYDREGRHFRMTTNLCKASDELFQLNSAHDTTFIRDVYRYAIDTQPGDCGAILVAYEPTLARKIVASHSAGDTGELSGIGCAIHRELIDELLSNLECRYPESINNGTVPHIVEAHMGDGGEVIAERPEMPENLIPIQKLTHPVFSPAKTKIRPSPVQGMIRKPTTKPALLRKTKKVDPLALAMKKVTTPSVLVDADCMDRCREDLTANTLTRIHPEDQRVLTFEEAITGIVGNQYYPPINRMTSPGFGWKKSGGRGKTPWLGSDEYILDNSELVAAYVAKLTLARAGRRIGTVWTDTLKDEARPNEKVDAGKTRLFSCGEMASTILFRQYFGGYIAHVTRNNVYNECAVGINVYGPDWERVFRHVTEVGPEGNAGDFENFDGTLGAALLWAVYDDAKAFYANSPDHKDEDDLVRLMLWLDIVNSVHVQGDLVYMWDHSQPSGCPFTSILNSRAQAIGLRYVFLKMAEKYAPKYATLDCYRKYIRLIAYGDDNVIGVHPEIQSWFNYQTLAEGFALLGMKYTDETKKEATVPRKRIEDVTFLKRGFRWEDGRLFAPLSIDTIVEMPNWVCGRNGWTLTAQIIEDALYELSQHDKETFDGIRAEFNTAIQAVQKIVPLSVHTQQEYRLMTETRHWQLPVGVNRYLGVEPRVVFAQMENGTAPGSSVTFGDATETAEKHTITRFYHDGELISSARARPPMPTERNTAVSDGEQNTLLDILSRPVQLFSATWPLTSIRGTKLGSFDIPDAWITNPMISRKLSGFRFYRCDIEVELQVNAQPFNAGAIYMWFEPYADQLQSVPTSTMFITGRTGYPNVQLFLEDATSAKLVCPYVTNQNAYTYTTEAGVIGGKLHLEILSQLTGSLDAEITLYMWAKNIRVEQPTQTPLGTYINAQAGEEEWPEPEDQAAPGSEGAYIDATAIQTEEKIASKPGTSVSKILGAAGKAVSVLSVVPEVGVVAAIAGGVLSLGGLIAGAFGWSKPLDQGTNQMVQIGLNRNLTNFNGDSKAKVAAIDATNKVDMPVDAFRSTKDEMAFRSMLGKELYIGENQWAVTDVAGSTIVGFSVAPELFYDSQSGTVGGQNGTFTAMHYAGALAQLFRYWRGSLEFRFKLVKTQYHSGRIEVLWFPGEIGDAVTNPEMMYREIHDIRSKNEFVVKIPFNYPYPWCSLVKPGGSYTGRLFVRVLNPLRAPTTVAQSVKVLTYMRAGPDFQFAMPRSMRNTLVAHTPKPTVNAQANFTEVTLNEDTKVNQRGVGEAVLSARTLCRRYVDFQTNGGQTRHSQDCISAAATYAQLNTVDYLSIFGMFYRMRSGGVRILKSFTQGPGSVNKYSILREGEPDTFDYLSPAVYNWTTLEPTLEIVLPFYQRVEFIPTNLGEPSQSTAGYDFNLGTDLKPAVAEPTGTETLRSISEDFNFGFLLGPPSVFVAAPSLVKVDDSHFDSTYQVDRVCAKRAAVLAAGGAVEYPIHKVLNDVKDA